jgi:hypothetical protein
MFFEKLIKWVSSEASHRSGVLTSPTALVFDPRHKVEIPPIISFEHWAELRDIPPKAVAFLQIYADATNVLIVDVEKRQLVSRVDVPNKCLGEFTTLFLTADRAQLRSILQAPRWLVAPLRKRIAAAVSASASAEMTTAAGSGEMRVQGGAVAGGGYPPDASTDGVRPGGDRPPDPPRVQALVTLAEETASLQVLPVVGAEPLDN